MRFMIKISIFFILCSFLFSCPKKELDYSWVKVDEKQRWVIKNFNYIEYKIIKEEFKELYLNLLNDREYLIIGKEECNKILKEYTEYEHNYDNFYNNEIIEFNYDRDYFYIIRAVNKNYFHNNYIIFITKENELFITHHAMGSKTYWIDKDAIILSLENIPEKIYINSYITK